MKTIRVFSLLMLGIGVITQSIVYAQITNPVSYATELTRRFELVGVVKELSNGYIKLSGKTRTGKDWLYRVKLGTVIVPVEVKPGVLVAVEYTWVSRRNRKIRLARLIRPMVTNSQKR